MSRSSEVPGFYRRTTAERREFLKAWADLSPAELAALEFPPGVDAGTLERMIENVVGVMPVPVGIATNFVVNGRDYLVPDDVKRLAIPVFAHRIVLNSRYVSTQRKSEQTEAILQEILDSTRVPL